MPKGIMFQSGKSVPYSGDNYRNYYERYMKGDAGVAGWVDASDYGNRFLEKKNN